MRISNYEVIPWQKKPITNKHTIVFIMQLLKSEGPEDQLKCQALVWLLQVSKRAVAFLVSCLLWCLSAEEKTIRHSGRRIPLFPRCNAGNIIYTVLRKSLKLFRGKTRCKAWVPPLTLAEMQSEWTAEKNKESIKICCFLPKQRQRDSVHCRTHSF